MGRGISDTVESYKASLRQKPLEAEIIVELNGLIFNDLANQEDSLSSRKDLSGGRNKKEGK